MFLLVLAAAAATPAAPAPPSAKPAKGSDEEIVCQVITPVGSRLGGKRKCATRLEWRKAAEITQREVGRFQDAATSARQQ